MRLSTIISIGGTVLLSLAVYSHAAVCKAVPGTPSWPSIQDWTSFNKSLGGVLLKPLPPGGVCHPDQPNYNAALCPIVTTLWNTSFEFHEDDPISNGFNNWNNDTCLPLPGAPCSGEGYPIYVVNATKPEHVQKAIDFARERNIRLNVKCSGFDYLGRSVAPNSLSIWVHYMQGIQTHKTFTPQGASRDCDCYPEGIESTGPAITFSAGDTNGAVYTAANKLGMAVPVTGGHEVCYGGYVTGGGHSVLGAKYGLAADLILELTVVTPDGQILVANACQNRDLFWALRGGGGATFGVILTFTMKMYPDEPTTQIIAGMASITPTSTHFYDAAAYAFTQYPAIVDAGWAGYGFVQPTNTAVPGLGSEFYVAWFGFGRTEDEFLELVAPTISYINHTWPGEFVPFVTVTNYSSFYEYWSATTNAGSPIGVDAVVGSRLLDKKAISSPNLAAYLETAVGIGSSLTNHMMGGPGIHSNPPTLNSVCPAWRTAYSHFVVGAGWYPFSTAMETAELDFLSNFTEASNALSPNTGAYINEADPLQPNYHEVFWGTNYPRLLAIKKKVDPHDVFWCRACVGNEGWEEAQGRLCKV